MAAISIWDVALDKGVKADAEGRVNGAEFFRLDLPLLAGCQVCAATLAPGNSYPSMTGYIRCRDCIGDLGFPSVAAFEAFERRQKRS